MGCAHLRFKTGAWGSSVQRGLDGTRGDMGKSRVSRGAWSWGRRGGTGHRFGSAQRGRRRTGRARCPVSRAPGKGSRCGERRTSAPPPLRGVSWVHSRPLDSPARTGESSPRGRGEKAEKKWRSGRGRSSKGTAGILTSADRKNRERGRLSQIFTAANTPSQERRSVLLS